MSSLVGRSLEKGDRPLLARNCPNAYALSQLPRVSIIICFHNEAWSTLLRTIHSIIDRTPAQLLAEILLVDDFSTYDYLKTKLENYIATLPRVYLMRSAEREGLAKARMRGVGLAKGEILVFMDSHCEVNTHWLEPLLQAIVQERTKIVSPQLDVIEHNTFAYKPAPEKLFGGFTWGLDFNWKPISPSETQRRKKPTDSIRTPAMAGGLFAVDKFFFLHLGGFDQGMDIWGGENLELSFRTWMCGGSLEILPCSRVGHVFRPLIPYGFPGGPKLTLRRNSNRVAEIWLDNYRSIYYSTLTTSFDAVTMTSVQNRLVLKQKLKCKPFSWYLKTIVPEMPVPQANAEYFGQVRNSQNGWCLSSHAASKINGVTAMVCDEYNIYQLFTLTSGGNLVHSNHCLTYFATDQSLHFAQCDPSYGVFQQWKISQTNHIQLDAKMSASSVCLDVSRDVVKQVYPTVCEANRLTQQWHFTYHFNPERLRQNHPQR